MKARNYKNSFFEVDFEEKEVTVYNREQALKLKQELGDIMEELNNFIDNAKD